MLGPPPVVPLRPRAPRPTALPTPRTAKPNTDPTTTTTTTSSTASAGKAATMGAAAWWRRALGQRLNPAGVAAVAAVAASEPRLALPHVSLQDIRWLDWAELRHAGFRGVVFDKDNTLTAPYVPALWPPLADAFDQCRATFPPGALAIYSNSAGLKEYDPDGVDAKVIEAAIEGIHVIRHDIKKPGGTAKEIESYFGCSASNLVLVGDRYFTDVVYGNRNGFLTVLTEPLNFANESYIVRMVRKLEAYIISYWYKKGHKPIKHPLLPDARRIVKFDPYDDSSGSKSIA
ncbi:phosphatidylglycerophosphate phosphatase 1, chloroplastic/mitochondrial-like [Phragmites australis]|uniref:phosphatidylglycerophosphate phosphatase 1, chloroplastic/mitochondrial-like n=1 Tax=Phragmites australis TaxID=29695 RepID=UPI002D776D93|nr:phosphatidylglycerophosphate phosphatase 1, chloroplastic/mitochondrial-like [Phragmites australis]